MNFCPECGAKFLGGKFCSGCAFDLSRYVLLPAGSNSNVNVMGGISELDEAFKLAVQKRQEEILAQQRANEQKLEQERLAEQRRLEQERINKERLEREQREKEERFKNRFQIVGVILSRYLGEEEVVTIPENIKYIGINCFQSNRFIKKVVFPSGLIKIDECAFFNCQELEEVEFKGSSVSEIGKKAFMGCSKLKSIIIPRGVTEISENAFLRCSSLESVVFSGGIVKIDSNAFSDCSSLKKIELPSSLKILNHNAFNNCRGLKEVNFPSSIQELGSRVFQGCVSLERFYFPSNMQFVRYGMFDGCISLSEVSFPNCANIEAEAFKGCINLINIKLPSTLQNIGKDSFMNCSYLNSITIPSSVKNINPGAFFNTNIKSVTLPQGCSYNLFRREDRSYGIYTVDEPSFPRDCNIVIR